jgi:hypothetical protein
MGTGPLYLATASVLGNSFKKLVPADHVPSREPSHQLFSREFWNLQLNRKELESWGDYGVCIRSGIASYFLEISQTSPLDLGLPFKPLLPLLRGQAGNYLASRSLAAPEGAYIYFARVRENASELSSRAI